MIESKIITYGCRPTLGEVCGYYSRPDFLEFLLATIAIRRVIMAIPQQLHWELNWERDRVRGASVEALRDFIMNRIHTQYEKAADSDQLPYYPSFHQSPEYWHAGTTDDAGPIGRDGICESDQDDWRQSFAEVYTLVSVLQDEGVPYRIKFSGRRSLHLAVPGGGGALKVEKFGNSQAHGVEILRMPYSLNEDTGLVSLPLDWERLHVFRPWQANLHVVDIERSWLAEPSAAERDAVRAFIAGMPKRAEEPRRPFRQPMDQLDALRAVAASPRLRRLAEEGDSRSRLGLAWSRLCGMVPVGAGDFEQAWHEGGEEVRWLNADAFLLHGDRLPDALVPELTRARGLYLQPAAMDLAIRFAEQTRQYYVELLTVENMGTQGEALGLLARQDELRAQVIADLGEAHQRTGIVELRLALVTGLLQGNWTAARGMVEAVREKYAEEPGLAVRLEAFDYLEQYGRTWWTPGVLPTAKLLAGLGSEIMDLLLLSTATTDNRCRKMLLMTFWLLGDVRALDYFIENLGARYQDCVRWATSGLVKLGAELAIPVLLDAAGSDEPRRRIYAIRCLGHLADPRALKVIRDAVQDADEKVCRQAVIALGKCGDASDIPRLQAVVCSRDWETAADAVMALVSLGSDGLAAVRELALVEQEPAAAAWLWRENGDPAARTVLLDTLNTEPRRQTPAILALAGGSLDDQLAAACIRYVRHSDDWQRVEVAGMLATSRRADVRQLFLDLAGPRAADAPPRNHLGSLANRKMAAAHLREWDDPAAIAALVHLLGDENARVRQLAADGLLQLGEKARDAVAAAAADHSVSQRQGAARQVLKQLTVVMRLNENEPFSPELVEKIAILNCTRIAIDILRRRGWPDADMHVLANELGSPRHSTAWQAKQMLVEVGEPARATLHRLLAEAPLDDPRHMAAEEILQQLAAEQDEKYL